LDEDLELQASEAVGSGCLDRRDISVDEASREAGRFCSLSVVMHPSQTGEANGVGVLCGDPVHPPTCAAHQDRNTRLHGTGLASRVGEYVVLTGERDSLAVEQLSQGEHRFFEPADSGSCGIEGDSRPVVLGFGVAGSEPTSTRPSLNRSSVARSRARREG
jgi:hypothetical protein